MRRHPALRRPFVIIAGNFARDRTRAYLKFYVVRSYFGIWGAKTVSCFGKLEKVAIIFFPD